MLREFENLGKGRGLGNGRFCSDSPEGSLRAVELAVEKENENPHWLCQTARLKRKSLSGGN